MPKGIPLTPEEFEERQQVIAEAAVALFLKQGFNETAMKEIARAAEMGKSTLYDYFPSKDEIVIYLIQRQMRDLLGRARLIYAQETGAEARLRKMLFMHLDFLLEQRAFFLKLSLEAQRLKSESQQRIQTARYAYQDMLRELIEQGIQEGSFRPVDATMTMKTILTMLTPVVYTSRPSGTPHEMLEAALDLILHGLLPA